MSDIINIEDLKRLKELRNKYEKQKQTIQYEIERLQSQLEILDYYLGDNLDNEWHSKPPLSNEEIQNIHKEYMATYDPTKYTHNKDKDKD